MAIDGGWIVITALISFSHLSNGIFHLHKPHRSFAASLKLLASTQHRYSAGKSDFLLRCPRPSEREWETKANFSIRLGYLPHDNPINHPTMTITQSGSARNARELIIHSTASNHLEMRQWGTLKQRLAALIYARDEWSFEFEEAKRWFALRIVGHNGSSKTNVNSPKQGGRWLCELTMLFRNGSRITSETSREFVPSTPPTSQSLKPTRRRRIKANHSHQVATIGLEMPDQTPPQAFSFSKHESELAVFQRLSKIGKVIYARGGDAIEYSRNRPHYGNDHVSTETTLEAETSSSSNHHNSAIAQTLVRLMLIAAFTSLAGFWLSSHTAAAKQYQRP